MPRRSAASIAAASEGAPTSPTINHDHTADGDTSLLSAQGEPSTPVKAPRTSTSKQDADTVGIDELLLPRTLTSRLARGMLPANTSIQKDALLALTKSATVFISHLASLANEQTSKKTIGPQDVIKALEEMELGQLMGIGQPGGGRLERELEMWETAVKGKRKGYREKVKARESGGVGSAGEEDERGEPVVKRARLDDGVDQAEGGQNDDGDGDADASMGPPPLRQRLSLSLKGTNGNGTTNGVHESSSSPREEDPAEEEEDEDEDEEEGRDGDETESVEDDDEEDDEDEQREESAVDDYGPDEQLRHEAMMNENGGVTTEDESD